MIIFTIYLQYIYNIFYIFITFIRFVLFCLLISLPICLLRVNLEVDLIFPCEYGRGLFTILLSCNFLIPILSFIFMLLLRCWDAGSKVAYTSVLVFAPVLCIFSLTISSYDVILFVFFYILHVDLIYVKINLLF